LSRPPRLPDEAKRWLDDGSYVTFATVEAGGRPHLTVMWATHDGDDVLLSTITARRKYGNVVANPRVSVLWFDQHAPLNYVEVRGTATATTDGAIELIEQLAQHYVNRPYRELPGDVLRVTIRVTPQRIVFHRA
jgi:PPOX class probable F420-dependent enzyme